VVRLGLDVDGDGGLGLHSGACWAPALMPGYALACTSCGLGSLGCSCGEPARRSLCPLSIYPLCATCRLCRAYLSSATISRCCTLYVCACVGRARVKECEYVECRARL
jgi:hypothetical protein